MYNIYNQEIILSFIYLIKVPNMYQLIPKIQRLQTHIFFIPINYFIFFFGSALVLTVQRRHVLHFLVAVLHVLLAGIASILASFGPLCSSRGRGKGVGTQRHFHGTQRGQASGQFAILQRRRGERWPIKIRQ